LYFCVIMRIDNEIIKYFLKALALYLIYYFIYELWIGPDQKVDIWLNELLARAGYNLLNIFGYVSCIDGSSICVRSTSTVIIGRGCNGFDIYCIFASFIILFPGVWWKKIIYIIFGIAVIFISNIMRVTFLAIDRYYDYKVFYYNHKYTYVFVVYAIVFGLWVLWITKFTKKNVVS
jgi:exosortase/archaeosortase family protein